MPHPAQVDDLKDALGLVKRASRNRAELGDRRPEEDIANALLSGAAAPSLRQLIGRLNVIVAEQESILNARVGLDDERA